LLAQFVTSELDQILLFPGYQKMKNEKVNSLRILGSRTDGDGEGGKGSVVAIV
jgi:hypothetical protein